MKLDEPALSVPATAVMETTGGSIGLSANHSKSRSLTRPLLLAVAINMLVLSGLMHAAGLSIDPGHHGNMPYFGALLTLLALRLALPSMRWRHALPLARFCEYAGLFTLISLMGATMSYPIAALTHGYADAALQHMDERFGFAWLHWYKAVAAHPLLQFLGTTVYRSIYITPALILGWAAWNGTHAKAYSFLASFWLAAVITLALFTLMPAVGPFSYLWHGPIPYMPESEMWQSGLIPALRARTVHFVDLEYLRGIVSAPSFHTAAAVVYVASAWRIASMRWPILALNAAMLLSTPVEGTHYLTDMVIGAMVAVVALLLIRRYECGFGADGRVSG